MSLILSGCAGTKAEAPLKLRYFSMSCEDMVNEANVLNQSIISAQKKHSAANGKNITINTIASLAGAPVGFDISRQEREEYNRLEADGRALQEAYETKCGV